MYEGSETVVRCAVGTTESFKVKVGLHQGSALSPFLFAVIIVTVQDSVGSVVEWLKHRTDDQHGLGSKPTQAILLCPWERHFTALSPAWWS